MNLVIVTQNAPMYLAAFLDDFLNRLTQTCHQVHSIVLLSPFPSDRGRFQEVIRRYQYYGLFDFFKMLGHIARERVLSYAYGLWPSVGCHSIDNVIRKYRLMRYPARSINSKYFIKYLYDHKIDVVISVASLQIFKKKILKTPRYGCINYHTGLLPRYRGRQPVFWALLNDESEIGISVHLMDEQIDNGPILAQERIAISPDETLHTLYLKTIRTGPGILIKALNQLDAPELRLIDNPAHHASYYGFPTRADVKLFKTKGKRFF